MISRSTLNLLWCLSIGFSATNLLYFWAPDNFGRWGMALSITAVFAEVWYRMEQRRFRRMFLKLNGDPMIVVSPTVTPTPGDE